jgi:hypothetical protein
MLLIGWWMEGERTSSNSLGNPERRASFFTYTMISPRPITEPCASKSNVQIMFLCLLSSFPWTIFHVLFFGPSRSKPVQEEQDLGPVPKSGSMPMTWSNARKKKEETAYGPHSFISPLEPHGRSVLPSHHGRPCQFLLPLFS